MFEHGWTFGGKRCSEPVSAKHPVRQASKESDSPATPDFHFAFGLEQGQVRIDCCENNGGLLATTTGGGRLDLPLETGKVRDERMRVGIYVFIITL